MNNTIINPSFNLTAKPSATETARRYGDIDVGISFNLTAKPSATETKVEQVFLVHRQ